ncbi:MAG: hypothetical protein Q9O74_11840 [Planctomycetota bacterium]|nr:hypothetical protein [Planctomycetota bacterium]
MRIVPKSRSRTIEFYETRAPVWAEDPAAIGLTAERVAAVADRAAEARDALEAHLAALEASRAATARFYAATDALHADPGAGADTIATIKNFARTTDDPGVYVRAMLPAPPPTGGVRSARGGRGSAASPGTPFRFRVSLLQDGAVGLAWDCDNPTGTAGTVYEVFRRTAAGESTNGRFDYLGTVGEKSFLDATLPPDASPVTYRVTARRGKHLGRPARHTVRFGQETPAPSQNPAAA